MKRFAFVFLFAAVLPTILMSSACSSKKGFEGIITLDIRYQSASGEWSSAGDLTYFIKGDFSRIEQPLGMGMKQVVISNHIQHTRHILIEMMGKKVDIAMEEAEYLEMESGKLTPSIEYPGDKKEIAGEKCKKAMCTFEDQGRIHTSEVYYTADISNEYHGEFPGLKGFPLEYESSMSGMRVLMVANNLEEKELEDTLFEVPEGYESVTMQEFQNMLMEQN